MQEEGRDEKGRFVKGAPAGPGRPPRRTEREFLRRLIALCTNERLDAVLMRLIADAAQGNADARKLLLEYLIGRPAASAPTPTQMAVEDEAGIDPVGWEIMSRKDASP